MEDAHVHILSLPNDPEAAFFGVFDGHGGAKVAQYAAKHLYHHIVRTQEYSQRNIAKAMKIGFLDMDEAIAEDPETKEEASGSTAITILIRDQTLYCANIGDSRAIACVGGQLELLSWDHKPNNEVEFHRIVKAGGWVEFNRVNGVLALSRAFGDFVFKNNITKTSTEQMVTAFPDVEIRPLSIDWEFVIVACDGIWDVMGNQEALDFVRDRLAAGLSVASICEDMLSHCLAVDGRQGARGSDNMTVIIICFLHQRPFRRMVNKLGVNGQRQ